MNCSCPKCKAPIELDQSQLPEDESTITCTACNTRFLVYRESFACRALRKSGEIYCAKCANELGPLLHCSACGALQPEYFVVALHRKRVREKIAIKADAAYKPGTIKRPSFKPLSRPHVDSKETTKLSTKTLKIAGAMVVIAVVIAVSIGYYYHAKAGKQYSASLITALYGIKSGTDMSLKTCSKISTEWKSKLSSGSSLEPRLTPQEESDLTTVKIEIDAAMQKLNPPPQNLTKTIEKLANLNDIYNKIVALAISPQGSLSTFTDSTTKLENDFNRVAQEFKATLPADLREELRNSTKKYKNLQFLN